MGTAARLTPRVRIMLICESANERKAEAAVFDLKGVKQHITAKGFPFVPAHLCLFLLLSSPRDGRFPGYLRVINNRTGKAVFYAHLKPEPVFDAGRGVMPVIMPIHCSFPEAGAYTAELCFFQAEAHGIVKGEMPFSVLNMGN
jgi:hypothetical protein